MHSRAHLIVGILVLFQGAEWAAMVTAINLTEYPVTVALVRSAIKVNIGNAEISRHTKLYTEDGNKRDDTIQVHIIPPGQEVRLQNYPRELLKYDRDIIASLAIDALTRALNDGKTSGPSISYYNVGGTTSTVYILSTAPGKVQITPKTTMKQPARDNLLKLSQGLVPTSYTLAELTNSQRAQEEFRRQKEHARQERQTPKKGTTQKPNKPLIDQFNELLQKYKIDKVPNKQNAIQSAFRKGALKMHPDKTKGDDADFKILTSLYEQLKKQWY